MIQEKIKKQALFTLNKEQEALVALDSIVDDVFLKAVEYINNREGKIVITGVGKSGFIGMKIAATLTSLGQHALFLHPVEALHGDTGMVGKGDVLIALSFSGGSTEVVKIVSYLKKAFALPVIAITGKKDSALAKLGDSVLAITVEHEGCPLDLAPMASTTATLVVGDMLASAIVSPETFQKKHFAQLHPGGTLGLTLSYVREAMIARDALALVAETTPLQEALQEITKKGKGVGGVINADEKVVGVITDGDIRRFLLSHDSIAGRTAGETMTKQPKTISEDETLLSALKTMETHKITSLFVVDSTAKVVGMLHIHDIIEDGIV